MPPEDLYAPVRIAGSAVVGENCTLGYPKEARLRDAASGDPAPAAAPVVVGERCLVFNQVVLYEGTTVGEGSVLEDRVRVGYDGRIGRDCRLMYGAYVCDRVTIEGEARVGGFVCDGAQVGARSTVMGSLVHEYTRPHEGWWEVDEEPPVIGADSVVGRGAQVVGPVTVGPFSYVAAGAVVTRDVPPHHIAVNVNELVPASRWPGSRLAGLIDSWTRPGAGLLSMP